MDLNEFNNQLETFSNNLEQMSEPVDVTLDELLSEAFLQEFTDFNNFDEFSNAFTQAISAFEDFDIPENRVVIQKHTKFDNFAALHEQAVLKFQENKLFGNMNL